MSNKDFNNFVGLMKKTDRLDETTWKATTAKRITIVIPDGVKVFDTDLNKMFVGDGTTTGGIGAANKVSIRRIAVAAAASGGLTADPTTDKITWTTYGADLRTGDAITIGSGGTIPTGLSATSYYIIKDDDVGDGSANINTSFKVATTRANALAGTAVNITTSGVAGWTCAISGFMPKYGDDIVFISSLAKAVDVFLPDANSSAGFSVTIKRANSATYAATIKEVDVSGNVAASGACYIDDAAGYTVLRASQNDYVNLFADATGGKYYSRGKQIS
jgi:hypothetical protein